MGQEQTATSARKFRKEEATPSITGWDVEAETVPVSPLDQAFATFDLSDASQYWAFWSVVKGRAARTL